MNWPLLEPTRKTFVVPWILHSQFFRIPPSVFNFSPRLLFTFDRVPFSSSVSSHSFNLSLLLSAPWATHSPDFQHFPSPLLSSAVVFFDAPSGSFIAMYRDPLRDVPATPSHPRPWKLTDRLWPASPWVAVRATNGTPELAIIFKSPNFDSSVWYLINSVSSCEEAIWRRV